MGQQFLVGGLEHFLFSHILGIVIPIDFHIFQRGSNHQPVIYSQWSMIHDICYMTHNIWYIVNDLWYHQPVKKGQLQRLRCIQWFQCWFIQGYQSLPDLVKVKLKGSRKSAQDGAWCHHFSMGMRHAHTEIYRDTHVCTYIQTYTYNI